MKKGIRGVFGETKKRSGCQNGFCMFWRRVFFRGLVDEKVYQVCLFGVVSGAVCSGAGAVGGGECFHAWQRA